MSELSSFEYRKLVHALEDVILSQGDEITNLRARIAQKDDAIDLYAEFYQKCASLVGLPDDCNPCSEADEIMLVKFAAYDQRSEVERLTARVSELVEQADEAYAPYRQMVIDARAEVSRLNSENLELRNLALETEKLRDQQVSQLREALAFYANRTNWETEPYDCDCVAWRDAGNTARAALEVK